MDPLNKHNTDDFKIKTNRRDVEKIEHRFLHQKLIDLLNYIKNALKSIVYVISPRSNLAVDEKHNNELNKDVLLIEPKEQTNFAINKKIFSFFNKVDFLWKNNRPSKIVDIFVKETEENESVILECMKLINQLIVGVNKPGMTQSEMDVLSKLKRILKFGSPEKISFIDIKHFYNVFMKCMNYAIKNEPEKAAQIAELEYLFTGRMEKMGINQYIIKDARYVPISDDDRHDLQSDLDFQMLLQELKENIQKPEHLLGPAQSIHMAIHNILDNKRDEDILSYDNLAKLQQMSDKIKKIILKNADGKSTKLEYDMAMFLEARKMGLLPYDSSFEVQRHFNEEQFSESDFRKLLSIHQLDEKMDKVIVVMEHFPDVIDQTLKTFHLDQPLSHIIDIHAN